MGGLAPPRKILPLAVAGGVILMQSYLQTKFFLLLKHEYLNDVDDAISSTTIPTSLLLVLIVLPSVAEQLGDVGVVLSSPWLDAF